MATNAEVAIGDIIEVETYAGSGVYFKLGEVTNLPPPNQSADSQEATHMESPGGVREFTPGLIDPGDQQLDLNYIAGNQTEEFVLNWMAARERRATRMTLRNGRRFSYQSFQTGWSPTGSLGDKRTASLGIKVSGQIARSSV